MDISNVLNVKSIKLNMMAKSKEEAIEELTDLLVQDGAVINKEDFLKDVWLREEQGSTGSKIILPSRMVNLQALPVLPWRWGELNMKFPGKRWMVAMSAALSYLRSVWWIKMQRTSDSYLRSQARWPMRR